MKKIILLFVVLFPNLLAAQLFEGNITDFETGSTIEGVKVIIVEDTTGSISDSKGNFSLKSSNNNAKTLRFKVEGYMFKEMRNLKPMSDLTVVLQAMKDSKATKRMQTYIANGNCEVNIPNNTDWNIAFEQIDLKGDLAPDKKYSRRDPSAVIKVEGKYYVWYSYSLSKLKAKTTPWDLNDIYYATSEDGYNWAEQGAAVTRGEEGSYDYRSVFTAEIFYHDGTFYLIYQAAADLEGLRNRNTIAMAFASSPDGPWTKLDEPVLHPTYTNEVYFDNNAVHDPCIIHFNDKFYLYYKGECNCFADSNCTKWCNPVCGINPYPNYEKQVKWGVAIADNPLGPYVKSEYNPITNTGHEVSVWNYNDGVAIMLHQDGPEYGTIQYAKDGVNFEIMGQVTNFDVTIIPKGIDYPEAAGLYRPANSDDSPVAGVSWGLCHVLHFKKKRSWMHIKRFENLDKQKMVEDNSVKGIELR